MSNVEAHLDRVFASAANDIKVKHENKIIQYKLYDHDMHNVIKEGKGSLVASEYDRSLDCNVYVVVDADTGERISGHQFRLRIQS